MALVGCVLCLFLLQSVLSYDYWDDEDDYYHGSRHHWNKDHGRGIWREHKSHYWYARDNKSDYYPDLTVRQLLDFKLEHPKPIGLLTLGSGVPVEIRDMIGLNADLYKHDLFFETMGHLNGEHIPPRPVLQKGMAVWGYFKVTNDISKYTMADVFNGVGKKTPVLTRFSTSPPGTGGSDLGRDIKGMANKFYTKDGILDMLSVQVPVFPIRDATAFPNFVHTVLTRNPKTNILDANAFFDLLILKPTSIGTAIYLLSDFGLPRGWRHSDFYQIQTFELVSKHGDRWYVRFNWRTEQGFEFITTPEVLLLGDPDFYLRDMYNAVENGSHPSWELEMDVMSLHDIQTVKFDPFDVTLPWKNGTYHTVTVGRYVATEISDNQFRDAEQGPWDPTNLVPGIPGPVDALFRGRRFAYRDAQNRRLGRNHLKIGVNSPDYAKQYVRDGAPPVSANGKDAPNYYQNSFNGPLPFVDDRRPKENLRLLESNAADLQFAADIYNKYLDEGGKTRLAANIAGGLSMAIRSVQERTIKTLYLVSPDLAFRTNATLQILLVATRTANALAGSTAGLPTVPGSSGYIPGASPLPVPPFSPIASPLANLFPGPPANSLPGLPANPLPAPVNVPPSSPVPLSLPAGVPSTPVQPPSLPAAPAPSPASAVSAAPALGLPAAPPNPVSAAAS